MKGWVYFQSICLPLATFAVFRLCLQAWGKILHKMEKKSQKTLGFFQWLISCREIGKNYTNFLCLGQLECFWKLLFFKRKKKKLRQITKQIAIIILINFFKGKTREKFPFHNTLYYFHLIEFQVNKLIYVSAAKASMCLKQRNLLTPLNYFH